MRCPFCQSEDLKVIDSRNAIDANAIRRRRECQECGKRFTTFETVELAIQVQKRDGRYEEYQQQKLIHGLEEACRHTRISHEEVLELAARITGELMQRQEPITTLEIGEMVMDNLRILDPVAYIRFTCVCKRIKDIDEVIKSIELTRCGREGEGHGLKKSRSQKI